MTNQCTFALWQAAYAERGIATFPVRANKVPAIRGYQKIGLTGSQQLAYSAEPASDFFTAPREGDFWADVSDPGGRPFPVALP